MTKKNLKPQQAAPVQREINTMLVNSGLSDTWHGGEVKRGFDFLRLVLEGLDEDS